MSSVDKTAVIYARYSSHGQTKQSIDGQIAAAQKYAEGKGYTIIHIYADRAMTGRNDDREQFQKMLSDTATHQFGVILLWKIDRFGRNREEIAFNRYRCKKNGVRVERVAEDVPDGPEGVILDSVLEGMAEYYSLQLAQNVRRGQRESAKKSQSNGGTRMIGYKVNPDTKRYEIDPDTAPFITEVFRRYAGGQTMAEIAAWLNAQGLRATRGGMFTVNSLHRLLKNEKYTGVYIFRDIRNEGGMPALIDRATFDKVQEMLKVNRRAPSRVWSRAEYLLTDKLFCGHCGAPMAGVSGHGHTGVKHNYYTCLNRKRKKSCTKKSVRQDVLEPLVLKSIRNLLQDDATLKYIADRVWAEYERSDTSGDTIRALDRQIADVDRALSNVMKAIEMGIINEMTKARMDELTEQKQALSAARADAGLARGFKLTRNMILYFLRKMAAMDISDRDSQKRLIKTFVNAIYLYDDHFDIAFNYTENGKVIVKMQEIDDASTGGAFGCCAQCPTKIKGPAEISLANPIIQCLQFALEVDIKAELIVEAIIQLIHGHADIVLCLSNKSAQRDASQLTHLIEERVVTSFKVHLLGLRPECEALSILGDIHIISNTTQEPLDIVISICIGVCVVSDRVAKPFRDGSLRNTLLLQIGLFAELDDPAMHDAAPP